MCVFVCVCVGGGGGEGGADGADTKLHLKQLRGNNSESNIPVMEHT